MGALFLHQQGLHSVHQLLPLSCCWDKHHPWEAGYARLYISDDNLGLGQPGGSYWQEGTIFKMDLYHLFHWFSAFECIFYHYWRLSKAPNWQVCATSAQTETHWTDLFWYQELCSACCNIYYRIQIILKKCQTRLSFSYAKSQRGDFHTEICRRDVLVALFRRNVPMKVNSLSQHTQFQGISNAFYSLCSALRSYLKWFSASLPREW